MTNKTLIILTIIAASFLGSSLASAGTQDDIGKCRAAFSTQTNIDMSDYRLRFKRQDGISSSRARTLFLKAISFTGNPSFEFSCSLDKNTVVAINEQSVVLYASR